MFLCPAGGLERLADHLPTPAAVPTCGLRPRKTQIVLKLFKVENGKHTAPWRSGLMRRLRLSLHNPPEPLKIPDQDAVSPSTSVTDVRAENGQMHLE